MTKRTYIKKYNNLWNQALKLPRVQAIKKLEECAKLKTAFLNQRIKKMTKKRKNNVIHKYAKDGNLIGSCIAVCGFQKERKIKATHGAKTQEDKYFSHRWKPVDCKHCIQKHS